MDIKSYIKELKDYELKYLSKKFGYPSPGNITKDKLRIFLATKKLEILKYLERESGVIKKEKEVIKKENWIKRNVWLVTITSFIIGISGLTFGIWNRNNPLIPKSLLNIEKEIPISVVASENGYMNTLTNSPVSLGLFQNYRRSLLLAENSQKNLSFYAGIEKDFGIIPKKENKELFKKMPSIRDKLEFAFFSWLSFNQNGYPPLKKLEIPTMWDNVTYEELKDLSLDDITYQIIPHGQNIILEYHTMIISTPKYSKINLIEDGYVIESNTGKLKITISSKQNMNITQGYKSDDKLIHNVYTLFNFDKTKGLRSEIYTIKISYVGNSMKANTKEAEIEREWVKRLINNAVKDFSFGELKEKLSSLDM